MSDESPDTDEPEVGSPESIDNEPDPGPDIDGWELLSGPGEHPTFSPGEELLRDDPEKRGTGRIFVGEDVERAQTEDLTRQMLRSTRHQLQIASEHIKRINWLETEGSRLEQDPDKMTVTRFEIELSSGKIIRLEGPVINVEFKGV